jgi:hypothetical protein
VADGQVVWVTKLSASCGTVESGYFEDSDLHLLVVTEGMWETTVLMDEFGGIHGFRVRPSFYRSWVPIPGSLEECIDDAEENQMDQSRRQD